MSIENLIALFKNNIWLPEDLTDVIWYEDDNYNLCWNSEHNVEDLQNGEGMTYIECVYEAVHVDGYVLYTLGDSCGGKFQAFFSKEKEVEVNG